LIGEREALAIRSKSLNYNYLTISDAEGSVLKVWMIGILPLMYLGVGIFVTVYTRSKQNEAI
jgi:ABC-2 type transport system permease protein